MTEKKSEHFAGKHLGGTKVNPSAADAIRKVSSNNGISCSRAFRIAEKLGIPPEEVGRTADLMEIRLLKCQLGLFGYQPDKKIIGAAENVSQELESAIRGSLMEGRLPCKAAWETAKKFKIPKMDVSSACEALDIKLSSCQLGAF